MTEPQTDATRATRIGLIQGAGAYLVWGLLPLYFMVLRSVDPTEVVASRVLWSLALLFAVVAIGRRGKRLWLALSSPRTVRLLACSAALISTNWLVYVWAVQNHHVLETSLGYFINPLINVLLGVVVLRERLPRQQVAAVLIAGAGVLVLALQAGGGLWISFALALSFGFYGLVRKVAPVESLEGLTIETMLMAPFAALWLAWMHAGDRLAFGDDAGITAWLVAAGAITAIPLLLFAAAARRLPYSSLGLLQYLAPTLQFVLAVTVFGEQMTWAHGVCFALIWTGLVVFVLGSMRRRPAVV